MTHILKRLKRESWLRQEQAGYEVSIAVAGTMAQDHAFANVSFPILCLHQVASAVCPITTEAVRVWGPGCSCLSASSCSSSSTSSLPGGRKWPHSGSTAFLLALARVVSAVWGWVLAEAPPQRPHHLGMNTCACKQGFMFTLQHFSCVQPGRTQANPMHSQRSLNLDLEIQKSMFWKCKPSAGADSHNKYIQQRTCIKKYKEPLRSIRKRPTTQFKNAQKTWTGTSQKGISRWLMTIWKSAQPHQLLGSTHRPHSAVPLLQTSHEGWVHVATKRHVLECLQPSP